jgi:hypothetical protein
MLPIHFESCVALRAPADAVFAYLDDPNHLSGHMSQSSWVMAGSRMAIELDAADGRAVGSTIRLSGRVLGFHLSVEEVVIERIPPLQKVWETIGTPNLLVIGRYGMGFEITPQGDSSRLRVFIDYAFPDAWPARWLGRLLGNFYARWCTERMVNDAATYFR